jgi:hypothetical protein
MFDNTKPSWPIRVATAVAWTVLLAFAGLIILILWNIFKP